MKLKSLLAIFCFTLVTNVFAVNLHINPKADAKDKQSIAKNMNYPGYCEIEIINNSATDVGVFGTFDDGTTTTFGIYSFEQPHYISLFYNFYCHGQMYITITTPFSTVYSGWTSVNSTIYITPYLNKQLKASVTTR